MIFENCLQFKETVWTPWYCYCVLRRIGITFSHFPDNKDIMWAKKKFPQNPKLRKGGMTSSHFLRKFLKPGTFYQLTLFLISEKPTRSLLEQATFSASKASSALVKVKAVMRLWMCLKTVWMSYLSVENLAGIYFWQKRKSGRMGFPYVEKREDKFGCSSKVIKQEEFPLKNFLY